MPRPDVLVQPSCFLGESPRWDAAGRSLVFVDIVPGVLYRLDQGALRATSIGQELGSVNLAPGGALVLALRDGIFLTHDGGTTLEPVAPVEAALRTNRMNDSRCDPMGRLWAGTLAFDEAPGAGSLYRIAADGSADRVIGGLTIPNGVDWSPDGSLMYFVDSPTGRIDVLDYDADAGLASSRRPFATLDREIGVPDGLVVDAEGGVWVAAFGGGQVRRYQGDGSLSEVIDLPTTQVTSLCFGGDLLDDLYITTARKHLTDAELADQPLAGAVFTCRPGVRGHVEAIFGG
ncbi:MAG: SMP-30/gluconolactonase/LRE family protein [Actinomycetota bacterium]|nr:SMP-30/gluconolactonase/LRE family protein [Actinomycetota bacterium]